MSLNDFMLSSLLREVALQRKGHSHWARASQQGYRPEPDLQPTPPGKFWRSQHAGVPGGHVGKLLHVQMWPQQGAAPGASQGWEEGGGTGSPSVTHLEEPVVVNHAVLRVEEGKQRVLGVQQHLALPFLLAFYSLVPPLLKGKDL